MLRWAVTYLVCQDNLQRRLIYYQGEEFLLITALRFWERFFGWYLEVLYDHPRTIIYFPRCRAVHQWFCRLSLGVFFVDEKGRVLSQQKLSFGQIKFCATASGVVEGRVEQKKRSVCS